MSISSEPQSLAIVVKGWPRLSETFIAQELLALEQRGWRFDIWSLRHPTDQKRHPLHHQIQAGLRYLPEYLHHETQRSWQAFRQAKHLTGWQAAKTAFWQDFQKDPSRNRIRRFGQAMVLAAEMPPEIRGIYVHFLHTPASVARYAALMRDLPWGFSAHAKDIWTQPEWEKRRKLHAAHFGTTCTAFGAAHLRDLASDPNRIDLAYHGLDLSRFPPPPETRPAPDPFQILSVGRLVEKKGFDRLLEAFALLPESLNWRWIHMGGGGLKASLQEQAKKLGIADRIEWCGASDQTEIITALRQAHLFALPSRIAKDGDRDGLPNVLMEAASQKTPILSTAVSAIPEFITSGIHGILSEDTPQALADAILSIAQHPEQRAAMAEAAYQRLHQDFGIDAGLDLLDARLCAMILSPNAPPA